MSVLRHTATTYDYSSLSGAFTNDKILPTNVDMCICTLDVNGRGLMIENKQLGEFISTGQLRNLIFWATRKDVTVLVVRHDGTMTKHGAFNFSPVEYNKVTETGLSNWKPIRIESFRAAIRNWELGT